MRQSLFFSSLHLAVLPGGATNTATLLRCLCVWHGGVVAGGEIVVGWLVELPGEGGIGMRCVRKEEGLG